MPTLDDGKKAVEQGNLQQARLIFEAILQETPRSEEAWMGLAEVLTETDDKRICYENVLKINKNNRAAREALRNLEPQANPFIEQLQQVSQQPGEVEEEPPEAEETIISDTPAVTEVNSPRAAPAAQPTEGPPTYALIAIGVLLSVVVFAIGSGAVFFIVTSLTGG